MTITTKYTNRVRRHRRIRAKVKGDATRPRLAIFKSNRYIYAQIIDDVKRVTLASVSDMGTKGKTKTESAALSGVALAKAALAKGVTKVSFDRGGFVYTGRIRAFAESARAEGLTF
ncbi:MAG: 50S ribosomal protein L18 [Patescibacteria group bacterium]